jgi:hypothetical protein
VSLLAEGSVSLLAEEMVSLLAERRLSMTSSVRYATVVMDEAVACTCLVFFSLARYRNCLHLSCVL